MPEESLPTSPTASAGAASSIEHAGDAAPRDATLKPKLQKGTPEYREHMRELSMLAAQSGTAGTPAIHGGRVRSERARIARIPVMEQKVAELKAFLEEHGSRWMTKADEPLILQTARQLVLIEDMWNYLAGVGAIDAHGRPRGSMKLWTTMQNTLTRQLSALGCSPLARAELGANLAASKLDAAQAMRFARPRSERTVPAAPASSAPTGDLPVPTE